MSKRPGLLGSTFRSLSVRNFRLFASGQILSVAGTWMMVVAQDWLVLSLSGDSGTALGTVTALQFTPMLLLTLYGGRLADRYDKRLLLTVANLVSGVLALLLAALALSGTAQLWHVYLFALGLGTVNAFEVPARISFVRELVGPELLPNASALSAAYFNTARVVGPAVAGLVISAAGTGPVMLLNAASYLATVVGLRMMRPSELRDRVVGAGPAKVADGLRYLASRADLGLMLALVGVVSLFGFNFHLTLPLAAKSVFGADASAFGLLTTALAAGSLLAALVTTARRERPAARTVLVAALAFGALEAAAGWAPTFPAALVLLFLTGYAMTYFAQAANHRIQLGSDPRFTGRVMALYTLILQGSSPLGALFVGWLAEHHSVRAGLYLGGLASLAAALAALAAERLRARGARATSPYDGGTDRLPQGKSEEHADHDHDHEHEYDVSGPRR
ncbi:MFS transporter [Streptomyces sp. NPDC054796]